MSYMVIEAIHAAEFLEENGISCEVVDLRTVAPIDYDSIYNSIKKTKKVLVLDTGTLDGSISGEIVSKVVENLWDTLDSKPERLAMPNFPEGTSFALTKNYHVSSEDIVLKVLEMLDQDIELGTFFKKEYPHDVPGDWFTGPF